MEAEPEFMTRPCTMDDDEMDALEQCLEPSLNSFNECYLTQRRCDRVKRSLIKVSREP